MARQPGAPIEAKNVPRRGRPGTSRHLATVQESAEAGAIEREEKEYQDASRLYDTAVELANERGDGAIEIYKELIAQHGNARTLALREVVARSYFNMAGTLSALGRSAAALQTYDDLFAEFQDAPGSVLREIVASGRINQGRMLAKMGQRKGAAEALQQAIKIDPNQGRRGETQARLLKDYSDILQRIEAEELDIKQQKGGLVSSDLGYTSGTPSPEAAVTALPQQLPMEGMETIEAARKLLSRVYPEEAVSKALADLVANAGRETTGRAKVETRPEPATTHAATEFNQKLAAIEAEAVARGDGTLLRRVHAYREGRQALELPKEGGFTNIADAQAAGRLSATFRNLQDRIEEVGLKRLPDDPVVTEARRLKSFYYRQNPPEKRTKALSRRLTLAAPLR
jgi:tetratricopeptide (TPR) repeat protein